MTFFLWKSTISSTFVTIRLFDIITPSYISGHPLFFNFISKKVIRGVSENGWKNKNLAIRNKCVGNGRFTLEKWQQNIISKFAVFCRFLVRPKKFWIFVWEFFYLTNFSIFNRPRASQIKKKFRPTLTLN